MKSVRLKIIAVLQIAGGVTGMVWAVLALGNEPLTLLLTAIYAPFPLAVYAGYELWKGTGRGYWLSMVLQALQLVTLSSTAVTFQFFVGLAPYLVIGDSTSLIDIEFGGASYLAISIPPAVSGFSINFFAVWAFVHLLRLDPKRFTGVSELQKPQSPESSEPPPIAVNESSASAASPQELFREVRALTFDCYGTLIDWETGIVSAFRPILEAHNVSLGDQQLLAAYADLESPLQQTECVPYRDILARVCSGFGERHGFTPTNSECASIAESIAAWPPFDDTVAALKKLKTRFKLGILSNIDDDLFAGSSKLLDVEFDWIITAERVGAYKPSHKNFKYMLDTLGLPREQILHVAQSLYHDIAPAKELGFKTVWVNRRSEQSDSGATPASDARPDMEVASLAELVEVIGAC
ncbi:MAG: haloacid dehalogenase type II [Candidatus Zixiibacteriota bacterium]